ncbi:MAG TPA: prepilin-type N-terminal cleavage/methylation domain-containing protein [Patescibacteria group bacterium]|nr:prepilin-type N-terminal cleavage/methylation domain-containing protein [Patescibacteria group bacterium]
MKKTKNNKRQKESGFTLIELLVAVSIFAVFITFGASSLVDIIRQDQKVSVLRQTQENTRYILETITREARNANGELNSAGERVSVAYKVDSGRLVIVNTDVLAGKVTKNEYFIPTGGNNLQIITSTKDIGATSGWASGAAVILNNPADIKINEFTPEITTNPAPDPLLLIPPKLNITIKSQSTDKRNPTVVTLTTSVSPRNY